MSAWRFVLALSTVFFLRASVADGEVLGTTGDAQTRVTQFDATTAPQTDFGQEFIPQTQAVPPAVARARLDRLDDQNEVSAAGQGLAILFDPNLDGSGNPNDVGLDIGAFSDDLHTSWTVDASTRVKRALRLTAADVGTDPLVGPLNMVRSRLFLSGLILITTEDSTRDLSDTFVNFSFSITRRQEGRTDTIPLSGGVSLVGGANGSIEMQNATGALAGAFLPILDLGGQIEGFPVIRAIAFSGVQLPYQYQVTLNTPFELELAVYADLASGPDGVGATAVFGIPPEGLAAVFALVNGEEQGEQLAALLAPYVDATGVSFLTSGPLSLFSLFPACGGGALQSSILLFAGGAALRPWRGRRRRRRA
jgi:hypothetical protein